MPDKMNGFWEDGVLNKLPENVDYFKKELQPLLDEKTKSESVISSSLDTINTQSVNMDSNVGFDFNSGLNTDYMNNNGMDDNTYGQSQTKDKVRVLKPNNSHYSSSASSSVHDNYGFTPNNYYGGSYSDIPDSNRGYNSGSAQTLILICTAILVVLVVFVSLVVMKGMGI